MTTYVFVNNVNTTLADSLTTGDTSITLSSSAGLPTLTTGQIWVLTLNDAATGLVFEVVYVTEITGAVCTALRGQEGTSAQTWDVGDKAFGGISEGILSSFGQQASGLGNIPGNPLQFVNTEATAVDDFDTMTQLNTTPFTIPANALTAGAMIRLNAYGFYSATGTPDLSLQLEIGGQNVGTYTFVAEGTTQQIAFDYSSTTSAVGSSGTQSTLQAGYASRSNDVASGYIIIGTTSVPINTTISNEVNIFGQFSAASTLNTVTISAWSVEVLYPPVAGVIT